MAARELRYKWFEEIRKEYEYDSIAVAHNLNDNIETLLINLIRGTGLAGLTGMKPVNKKIIRPYALCDTAEHNRYCNQYNINSAKTDQIPIQNTSGIKSVIRLSLYSKRSILQLRSTLNETAERFTGINEIVN